MLGARRIARAYIPEPHPDPAKDAEFGLLALDDGSAGLYYAWLGASQVGMRDRFPLGSLLGQDALSMAQRFSTNEPAERSLALAIINALTASVWHACHYSPPATNNSFGFTLAPGSRLGMVGFFPSLVRQAIAQGATVTVVERKPHLVRREPSLEVTLDHRALKGCDKVVATAAMLINNSLDSTLAHCAEDAELALVGPTAGCFPEPLFVRGIDAMGGTLITDARLAEARLAAGKKIGDSGYRFLLTRESYGGTASILNEFELNLSNDLRARSNLATRSPSPAGGRG